MFRSTICIAAMLGAGSVLRAGELDGDKPVQKSTPVAVLKTAATELDGETPTAAHRRGGWGYGGGYRGGYGISVGFGRGYGYGSYYGGGYGNYYGGYQGGYSSYYGGYSSYYAPSYYAPSYVGYSYYPSYYGGGCW